MENIILYAVGFIVLDVIVDMALLKWMGFSPIELVKDRFRR